MRAVRLQAQSELQVFALPCPLGCKTVHKVRASDDSTDVSADVEWLANVFGSSDVDLLHKFRSAVLGRPFSRNVRAEERKQYTAVYWIWPVYSWPNMPPIGLVDRTLISLLWSVAPQ